MKCHYQLLLKKGKKGTNEKSLKSYDFVEFHQTIVWTSNFAIKYKETIDLGLISHSSAENQTFFCSHEISNSREFFSKGVKIYACSLCEMGILSLNLFKKHSSL